jgi:hypothetical protein
MMKKIDLAKQHKNYYSAKEKPTIEEFGVVNYISITGQGDPSGNEFATKLQILYPVAYSIKFICKNKGKDFVVPKLEGLWWFDETKFKNISMEDAPRIISRNEWYWRLLLRVPDFVDDQVFELAKEEVFKKKKIAEVEEVQFYTLEEGKVVQMLHVGPFDKEPQTLMIMRDFILENHFGKNGYHHEIYLSDFRKTPPEKLKTILREPVK